MTHTISWFEIPVTDYDRAVEFYATVLDWEIDEYENDDEADTEGRYGMIRTGDGEMDFGGALAQMNDGYVPDEGETITYAPVEEGGTIVYLAVTDLSEALAAVEPAGGAVLVPRQETGEGSYYAFITDTEGNRIGLMANA